MAHGHPLQHRNLIPNLSVCIPLAIWLIARAGEGLRMVFYHVLAPGHEALVDDLGRIVATGVNMDAFLHDRVGARS